MSGNNISFGKNNKFGQIQVEEECGKVENSTLSGMKIGNISIFMKYDTNSDGILTDNEMQDNIQKFLREADKNHDRTITKYEAKQWLKNNSLDNIKAQEWMNAIDNLFANGDVKFTQRDKNGNQTVIRNNSIEIYDKNGNLTKITENNTTTEYKNVNGKQIKTKETIIEDNTITTTTYKGDGQTIASKTSKKGAITITYDSKHPYRILKKEILEDSKKMRTVEYEYDTEDNVTQIKTTNPDGTYNITDRNEVTTNYDAKGNVIEKTTTPKAPDEVSTTTHAKSFTYALKNGSVSVIIDGKTTGLTNKDTYTGKIKLEKGETLEDGKFPKTLRMTLPDGYNGTMQLNLINEENGVYETNVHDRRFQISIDSEGNISVKAFNVDELKGKLEANQTEYKRIAEEKARQLKGQQELARLTKNQAQREANAKTTAEGQTISKILYNDMKGLGTNKHFSEHLRKINKDNVAAVVLGYNEVSTNESIAEAILDEVGLGNINKRVSIIENNIFNKLITKADKLGIDTSSYKKEFIKAKQSAYKSTINNENFDNILNSLASAISGYSILIETDKQEVANMTPEEKQIQTVANLERVAEDSKISFNNQLKQDGWAGKTVDWMSGLWASKNRKDLVQNDLDTFNAQVKQLKNCKTETEFTSKFKEIFGIEYNAEMILTYQKRSEQQTLANATYKIEHNFNDTVKVLLNNETLTNETQYVQTSSGIYGGTGSYVETATREQVYEREYNALAKFIGLGNIENGKVELKQVFDNAGLTENSFIDDKYKALHDFAKKYSEVLHANVMTTTENKGYDAFSKECEAMYNAAFGLTNDIARRVQDYNISQQTGQMVLKSVAKVGSIGLCFIPGVGVGLAALGTTVISAGVDILDRTTSEVGLKNGEINEILKNAAVDGATVLAGGGITKMLKNASTFARIGGTFVGDVTTGAVAEKLQTGEITIGGVAFQCVFSAAGNLIALKQIKNTGYWASNVNEPQSARISKGIKDDMNNYRDVVANGEVARNIEQSHVSKGEKEIVAEALEDVPTPQEVDAFRESLSKAPSQEQKAAIDMNNRAAAEASYKAQQIGNSLSDADLAKLKGQEPPIVSPKASINPQVIALKNDINSIEGNIKKLEQQIAGAKKNGKNTLRLEQILEVNKNKLAGKQTELKALKDALNAETPKVKNTPVAEKVNNQQVKQAKQVTSKQEAEIIYKKLVPDGKDSNFMYNGGFLYEVYPEYRKTGIGIIDMDNMLKEAKSDWKIHLYANSAEEWADVAQVAMPYLQENRLIYKTMQSLDDTEFQLMRTDNNGTQTGKSFTIYFRNEDEFLRVAQDLETKFKESGMKSSGTVTNEAQIGDSGFISYRHEGAERGVKYKPDDVVDPLKSKKANNAEVVQETPNKNRADETSKMNNAPVTPEHINRAINNIPDIKIPVEYKLLWENCKSKITRFMQEISDSTVASSEKLIARGKEIITDLKTISASIKDVHLKAKFQKVAKEIKTMLKSKLSVKSSSSTKAEISRARDYSKAGIGTDLPKNEYVILNGTETLKLANYPLDLSSSEIQAKFKSLKDGETITVGRMGDIEIPEIYGYVSKKHLEITRQDDKLVVKDISSNGTSIAQSVAKAPLKSCIDASNDFARTSYVGSETKIPNGYRDGGRGRTFNEDGSLTTSAGREIVIVDRTKDKYLNQILENVKSTTANMKPKQKAKFLQDYIEKLGGNGSIAAENSEIFGEINKGKNVLLGDIFNQGKPTAVCRHRSLLYKILGDEIGLKVELQRGNFRNINGGGGHAWNIVRFNDGTSAIFDAMHGKTSEITPGHVDKYAKYYFSTADEGLY